MVYNRPYITLESLQLNKFCVNFLKNWRFMHFLKMLILRGELMRFIIYIDNVQ